MSASLQRQKSLEQSKAQLQLDWEGRMEEVERKAYGKHQNIIQQLTQAKDKVSASNKITQETHFDRFTYFFSLTVLNINLHTVGCNNTVLYISRPSLATFGYAA